MSRTLSTVVPDQRTNTGARPTAAAPREHVHRAAVPGEFLTRWEADGNDRNGETVLTATVVLRPNGSR
ncbi:hypothetical protein ACVV2G_21095 [Streptomyces ziwulingensis]